MINSNDYNLLLPIFLWRLSSSQKGPLGFWLFGSSRFQFFAFFTERFSALVLREKAGFQFLFFMKRQVFGSCSSFLVLVLREKAGFQFSVLVLREKAGFQFLFFVKRQVFGSCSSRKGRFSVLILREKAGD
ncbi:hypothetical protein RhiirA5_438216 [Rhizophagus irregularis]|nr:hypothetical protein RhiirA5_438216 [Rhizophagus irregularis]